MNRNVSSAFGKTAKNAYALPLLIVATLTFASAVNAIEPAATNQVRVVDGIVQPKRPVADALTDAIQFLKKADGNYVPGKTSGELAGYFTSAFVNQDGSRASRQLAYPARQHAYFIFTFLHYQKYSGQREWLLRASDLADWDLAHSTPATAFYANIPFSAFKDGESGGGRDHDAIEPDKGAFIGSAYISLYEVTKQKKYLDAAIAIADTLIKRQGTDGSWPFRVVAQDGTVRQQFGGAPVFFVQFYEDVLRHSNTPAYRQTYERALKLMLNRNIKNNQWGTYHEDVASKPEGYLSAEPMSFTAIYLFSHAKQHPEYIEMGRAVLHRMEEKLVHTDGHPAAPAPAVSEQAGFQHMMPGHTARYCLALAELYKATGDEQVKKKAISGVNALTYMQSPEGLFRTFFQKVNEKNPDKKRLDWYSQHLYTVCHLLELMPLIPEAVPSSSR